MPSGFTSLANTRSTSREINPTDENACGNPTLMAQAVQAAQELSLFLQGACLAGDPLFGVAIQALCIAMPGIIMDIPGMVSMPVTAGTAQAGADPLSITPTATINAANCRPRVRPTIARNIGPQTLSSKDHMA